MTLTCVRHAQSEYNRLGLMQGRIDSPLSPEGIREARALAATFPRDFDLVFSSPLRRARDTAAILAPYLTVKAEPLLIERSMGEWEGTPVTDEKHALLGTRHAPPGGESADEVEARARAFLDLLRTEVPRDKKILVVTHAGVIYALSRLLGVTPTPASNLALTELTL